MRAMAVNGVIGIVWKQFTQRKLRSILTVIGVMIGISALVSLVMLSTALKTGITGSIDSLGSDIILLAPRAALGGGAPAGYGVLTTDDVHVLEGIPQVKKVSAELVLSRPIEFDRQTFRLQVQSFDIDESYPKDSQEDILSGRFLTSQDENSVNIGYNIAYKQFDKDIAVNSFIRINGTRYRVVGIFASKGSQQDDNAIYANINDIRKTIGDQKAVSAIMIQISPGADLDFENQRIIDTLKRYRGQEDFQTITPAKLSSEIGSLLGVVDIVVYSIACISLFVGALGIMNALYTSVLQRTKEIGTMKAVGATNSQILSIFVAESAILGFVGGVVGVIVGLMLAYSFVIPLNFLGIIKFAVAPDPNLIVGAILFSVVIGVIAGFLPALRASRLKPVDALRYE